MTRNLRPFTLNSRLGNLTSDDIIRLKAALQVLGYYNDDQARKYEIEGKPLSPYAGIKFFDELQKFQRNNDLKVDGVVNQDGPTHRCMSLLLGNLNDEVSAAPRSNRPSFAKPPKPNCALCVSGFPKVSGDVAKANEDQAESLKGNRQFGLYSKLYADCLCDGKSKPLNEYHDFLRRFSSQDPARAA